MMKHLHTLSFNKPMGLMAFCTLAACVIATPAAWPAEPTDIKLGREGPKVEAIRRALDSKTELECTEIPLACVIAFLEARHGIRIEFDVKALNDANVALDTPVTRTLKGVKLRSMLNLILRDLDLRYLVQDEGLTLTTIDAADETLETRVYLVRDLLPVAAQADGGKSADYQALIDAIVVTNRELLDPHRSGAIEVVPTVAAIVATHTQETQEKIQDLLAALRRAREQFKP